MPNIGPSPFAKAIGIGIGILAIALYAIWSSISSYFSPAVITPQPTVTVTQTPPTSTIKVEEASNMTLFPSQGVGFVTQLISDRETGRALCSGKRICIAVLLHLDGLWFERGNMRAVLEEPVITRSEIETCWVGGSDGAANNKWK
ncbi:hypothetical protein Tdes44962_MAKER08254 [Teratosphaeria destructans]|uniref:Uncharacterized protein n=1 Tax=Teratosphaeria destructans TaxID=418781 RepID=A0A9W7SX88_9PEZI|nr:hypothetical protein Tdes44962_MAKER08254 [Teratosphaeria destructans]